MNSYKEKGIFVVLTILVVALSIGSMEKTRNAAYNRLIPKYYELQAIED